MAFLDMSLETFTRILDEPSEISHEHSKVLIRKGLTWVLYFYFHTIPKAFFQKIA